MTKMSSDDQRCFVAAMKFLHEQDTALETHTPESFALDLSMKDDMNDVMFGVTMLASALLQFMSASFNTTQQKLFETMIAMTEEDLDE